MTDMVKVVTPRCIVCGKTSELEVPAVTKTAMDAGMFIQDAWPGSTADQREMLISGTHPACWEVATGGED